MAFNMRSFDKLYINGEWVSPNGNGVTEIINSANEQVIASVPMGNEEDVNNAVAAAKAAFPAWSQTSSAERARLLNAIADKMEERQEEFVQTIIGELGMPIDYTFDYQVDASIVGVRDYAERAKLMDEEEQIDNTTVVRDPIGVCALINPWNYPLHQLVGKFAPALAAGCTVIVKSASETPVHAFLLAEIIDEVGVPAGVFNLVQGAGRVVGAAMCQHPDVDMVSFTGSTQAGIRIAEMAAPTIKRVTQELGGKSAFIITEDAPLEEAVAAGIDNVMVNTGQTCTALTRMLVPASKYDEVVALAKTLAEKVTVGDPTQTGIVMGPMCSKSQRTTVQEYIQKGIDEGAHLVTGGLGLPEGLDSGFYVKPTIFANANNDMVISQEEIFGPVITIIPFADEAEAVAIANDSVFGLSGAVWAGTQEKAVKIAKQLQTGQVLVNGGVENLNAPFGGFKQSGNGREWGDEGLMEYVEVKSLHL